MAEENVKKNLSDDQQIINFNQLEMHIIQNVLSDEDLHTVHQWMDDMMPLSYEEFDHRVGITWDDYWLDLNGAISLLAVDPVKKYVGTILKNPQSIFNYPQISAILLNKILPQYFEQVAKHINLPQVVYMQTFMTRSILTKDLNNQRQHVRWHQDPSEYDSFADYTLVLMLSDPFNEKTGWSGGELLVKNGMPTDEAAAIKLTPKQNQAILFNNLKNSHLVTAIQNAKEGTTRDIVIINIYLTDPQKKAKG